MRKPAGSNALIGFKQRGGRDDNLMYKIGEWSRNIENDNEGMVKKKNKTFIEKSWFEYDFASDFLNLR